MKNSSRLKLLAAAASVARTAARPGGPSLAERAQSVPRLVRATLDGTYAGTSVARLAAVVGAIAYVVSPLDLVPEALLPVIGVTDDAVVISWALRAFVDETDRFLAWESGQGMRREVPMTDGPGSRRQVGGADAAGAAGLAGTAREPLGVVANRLVAALAESQSGTARETRPGPEGGGRQPGTPRVPGGLGGGVAGGLLDGTSSRVRHAATAYVMESVRRRLER